MEAYFYLILGLILLIVSGEFLVKGAVAIALRLKLSTLVIGMTIVSLGTSAPELLVSIKAALSSHPDITIGAIVGSNISNIGLILGFTALIFPIVVQKDTIIKDWPMMMGSTLLFVWFVQDGMLELYEGVIFIVILISFLFLIIYQSRKTNIKLEAAAEVDISTKNTPLWKSISLIVLGCVGLVYGADWMLSSAVDIAIEFGVSERVIGLTIVAFGTSLPELITSCVAAFRKEADISVGNLIGSNIFNLLAILGITSIIHPIDVSQSVIDIDNWFLIILSLLIFPIMYYGKKISRIKGLLLITFYVYYIYFLFL